MSILPGINQRNEETIFGVSKNIVNPALVKVNIDRNKHNKLSRVTF